MGKTKLNGREFIDWIDSETEDGRLSPSLGNPPDGRRSRGNRKQNVEAGSVPANGEGSGGSQSSEKGTVKAKSPKSVLKYIESLADDRNYFRKLEQALKENVSVLVPEMMSMEQFTKCLSNLRDSNIEADKSVGSDIDPIAEIRNFLMGKVA